ncbi:hypothetical protein HYC85_010496 [Camellia sinensis]|uniref:Dirigent protein n=1 Tax=Camellia sinensis TaxID=4442 RepID=A0A7J7HI14_CAMSI|nr:hypothetical protein HYC85_010496 [Camellia sinensis]
MASSSSSLISYTFTLFFNLALSLLLLLSTLSKTSTQGSFSEEVSEAITLKRMEKTTHLHFYFHDIVSGKNPTAVKIAGAEDGSVMGFGTTFMMNDPLTEGPESNSKLVGRAQGMYALASEKNIPELLMVVYYEFEQGIYNGSSISILGRNPVYNDVREMPIVGGSGVFRFARDDTIRLCLIKGFGTEIENEKYHSVKPFDKWQLKRSLTDFLKSSFSLTVPEDDIVVHRFEDLKKRKHDDPVAHSALFIRDLGFLSKFSRSEILHGIDGEDDVKELEKKFLDWRRSVVGKTDGIELNLEGVKFRLTASVPKSNDFRMRKEWEELNAFGYSRGGRQQQPDTIVLKGVPSP